RAPAAGTVASIDRHPGEVVNAGSSVLTVVAQGGGLVRVDVPEQEADAIQVGARATLHRGAWLKGDSMEGTVVSVSPAVTQADDRARWSPHIPTWGRPVMIKVDQAPSFLSGEAFDVRFQ